MRSAEAFRVIAAIEAAQFEGKHLVSIPELPSSLYGDVVVCIYRGIGDVPISTSSIREREVATQRARAAILRLPNLLRLGWLLRPSGIWNLNFMVEIYKPLHTTNKPFIPDINHPIFPEELAWAAKNGMQHDAFTALLDAALDLVREESAAYDEDGIFDATWAVVEDKMWRVLNEDGEWMANGVVGQVGPHVWIYADNVDGHEFLSEEDFQRLWYLEPHKED